MRQLNRPSTRLLMAMGGLCSLWASVDALPMRQCSTEERNAKTSSTKRKSLSKYGRRSPQSLRNTRSFEELRGGGRTIIDLLKLQSNF